MLNIYFSQCPSPEGLSATKPRTRQLAAKLTHFALSFLSQSADPFGPNKLTSRRSSFLGFSVNHAAKAESKILLLQSGGKALH